MQETIFGTYANDGLKVLRHRLMGRGVQHQHHISPANPLPDEAVTLFVQVGTDIAVEQVAGYITIGGSKPSGSRGVAANGHVVPFQLHETVWDSMSWGYQTIWKAELSGFPDGTVVKYQISAWAEGQGEWYADWPDAKATIEAATGAFFREGAVPEVTPDAPMEARTFVFSVDRFTVPAWTRDAVIYHVFVDRFYPGAGKDWLQTDDLNGICGGTLWGVVEKMDYVQSLGVNALWLSPVFPSPTHHGYDATDYSHVEPRLGGDDALHAVVKAAHECGIRVILDVAFNHASHLHPIFLAAKNDPQSMYRDWFTFDDSPLGYRAFFGVESMPQLRIETPAVRQWLIDVALHWLLDFDVDGFRLDVADGPGASFWAEFQAACKAAKPDCFCFGEVIDTPNVQREYVGKLDGLLDFQLCDRIRKAYGFGTQSVAAFDLFAERHAQYFPDDLARVTFVDNHDMDRFLMIDGGDKVCLRAASEKLFSLKGIPVLYYGTEVGVVQTESVRQGGGGLHLGRVPMVWGDEQDAELLAFYRQLIKRRRGGN